MGPFPNRRGSAIPPNDLHFSRAQGTPTNRDHDHAKHLSLTGARVGVVWMRRLGRVLCRNFPDPSLNGLNAFDSYPLFAPVIFK